MTKTLTLNIFLVAITISTFITYFIMAKNFTQIITGTNLYLTLGICTAFALAGANLILNDKPTTAKRNHTTTTNPTTEEDVTLKFAEMHRATLQREKEIT